MLAWPGRTLIVVAVLFGIQLVTGIFRFVAAFASEDLTGGTRAVELFMAYRPTECLGAAGPWGWA